MFDRGAIINIRNVGHHTIDSVLRLGYATRFFVLTLLHSGTSFRRLRLIIRELYFTGVLSMIIILVSGLFVGMVLGFQGYQTLKTYGSESALGVLVALSLVRELGPVVSALLKSSHVRLSRRVEKVRQSRSAVRTSSKRERAQTPRAATWYSGHSSCIRR